METVHSRPSPRAHALRPHTATWAALLSALLSAKLVIAIQLASDEQSYVPLLWLGSAVGGELVLASAFAFAAAQLRHAVTRFVIGMVAVVTALWMDVNIISYAIDQSPITWWRLQGGDGGGLEALDLLEPADTTLVIVLALVQAAVATWLLTRAAPRLDGWRRAPWIGFALGVALIAFDSGFAHRYNRGLGEQPVVLLATSAFDTWGTEPAVEVDEARWESLVKDAPHGATRPAITRRDAPARNAIVFFAEGIPRELTTLADATLPSTPRLAARAKASGVELTFHHATFHRSIAALFSFACSEYPPPDGAGIPEVNPRADCGEISQLLAPAGIRSGFFHSGPFGFYDKLAFFGGRNWDVLRDAASFDDDSVWRHRWGVDDRATVSATLDWIDSLHGDRFFAFVVPIAAHYPYEVPPDFPAATGSKRERFLNNVAYLDVVFDELMEGLEARQLADDTLVVFLADHGAIFPRAAKKTPGARLAYESNLHVPAVMFGAPLNEPARYDALTSHLDVVPTVIDALGLAPDPRHVGRSLFQPAPARRLFVGARSGTSEIVGFLDDRLKVLVDRRRGSVEVYDLARDPEEQDDIASDWTRDERQRVRADALSFAAGQTRHLRAVRTLGDELEIPAAVLKRLQVSLSLGGKTRPCTRTGDLWHCEGAQAPAVSGRREAIVDGVARDCLVVQPPPFGALRLTIEDAPALLSFVSQARLGRIDELRGAGSYHLTVRSDGRSSSDVDATRGARGRLDEDDDTARVSYAVAQHSLEVVVRSLDASTEPLCLALDDKSWRAGEDAF
jgi:Sulfatase